MAKYSGIKIMIKNEKRLYENEQGYVHCVHGGKLIEVITAWGNKSYVCHSCGEVVKKELVPTSL